MSTKSFSLFALLLMLLLSSANAWAGAEDNLASEMQKLASTMESNAADPAKGLAAIDPVLQEAIPPALKALAELAVELESSEGAVMTKRAKEIAKALEGPAKAISGVNEKYAGKLADPAVAAQVQELEKRYNKSMEKLMMAVIGGGGQPGAAAHPSAVALAGHITALDGIMTKNIATPAAGVGQLRDYVRKNLPSIAEQAGVLLVSAAAIKDDAKRDAFVAGAGAALAAPVKKIMESGQKFQMAAQKDPAAMAEVQKIGQRIEQVGSTLESTFSAIMGPM